jgi:hypothetical protein
VIPWERFRSSVAEAAALARPEEFDAYQSLGERYAGIRRWSPAFLEAFEFKSVPPSASLIRAIEALREINRTGKSTLPKTAPTGFVRQRWAPHVLPGGIIDRRYYELCVLSELRDRLRAGDVWVTGSRQYRSFEERLISMETFRDLQKVGALPVAVETDFERFIAGRRDLLDDRLAAINALLTEVAGWTLFPECFTHLRTGAAAIDSRVLMAGLLADGLNLGLTRMAEACSVATLGQLAWTSDWHIREETYALALQRLVNKQQREPFAAMFGSGVASSSDGQFFQAGGLGHDASRFNAHYGQKSGFKVYTHISDRYAPFYTKLIAATASEALHVLDALLYHQSDVSALRHHTDGGGDSDHVFALAESLAGRHRQRRRRRGGFLGSEAGSARA